MRKEELFATAKADIFGQNPECPKARVGRNIAINYFGRLVEDAEAVLLDMRVPHGGFVNMLQNAFGFSTDPVMQNFPRETLEAVRACENNFRARYQPLMEELALKAA